MGEASPAGCVAPKPAYPPVASALSQPLSQGPLRGDALKALKHQRLDHDHWVVEGSPRTGPMIRLQQQALDRLKVQRVEKPLKALMLDPHLSSRRA